MLREVQEWRMPDPLRDPDPCARCSHDAMAHGVSSGCACTGCPCLAFCRAISVDDSIKGQHIDYLIVDDVLAPTSPVDREKALKWFAENMVGKSGDTVDEARARVGLPPLKPEDES